MTGTGSGLGAGKAGASIVRPIITGGSTPDPTEDPKQPPKRFPLYTGPLVPARNAVISSQKRMPWTSPLASISSAKTLIDEQKDGFSLFYPMYKKRISEFQHKDINTEVLQKSLEWAISFSHEGNKLQEIYNKLEKINPALPDYIKYLLECQYGRRQTGFGPTNSNSADHLSYSSFFDFYRNYEKEEIIEVLSAAIFYQNVRLEIKTDDEDEENKAPLKSVTLIFTDEDKKDHTLITGSLTKGKMVYALGENIPMDLKDKALIHMADMIASNRQENGSNYVKITMGNPLEVVRLVSILVCHHHMNVDIGEIFEEVGKQLDSLGESELKGKWQELTRLAGAFHMADPDKLSPNLRASGYKFEHIKEKTDELFSEISALLANKPAPATPAPQDEEPEDDDEPAAPSPSGPSATLSSI